MAFNSCSNNTNALNDLCSNARSKIWIKLLGTPEIAKPRSIPSIINRKREEEEITNRNLESLVVQVSVEMQGLEGSTTFENYPNESIPFVTLSGISLDDKYDIMITLTDLKVNK